MWDFSIPISTYDFTALNVMGSVVVKLFFIREEIFSDVHFINPGKCITQCRTLY